ncbi:L-seryl-tRNA(Sec) selenium transferase [Oscillospiraceae bacterium PP1C4]
MDLQQALLRAIPQVDELLHAPELEDAANLQGRAAVLGAVRAELDALRASILCGNIRTNPPHAFLVEAALKRLEQDSAPKLRRVLNATGVALHTNLGRAPLASCALEAIQAVAGGYSNLEYDLEAGARGSRNTHIERLLCTLCGCEAALVVNNNAAAVLLALATFARGKDILVSRGELVEIGDSFRIPDIMEQSGGRLVEVGTTNKTHLRDYESALKGGNIGVLLKVHTSNFRIVGFTEAVSVRELSELGKVYKVPTLVDLGSGALMEVSVYPFTDEPTVPQMLREGADLVCFSGDKLLGGPQAGILLGRRTLIDQMRKNPLARALRIDKLSLAALEATLRLYQNPLQAKEQIPVLRMLCAGVETLRIRTEQLYGQILQSGAACEVQMISQSRPVGGGSVPAQELDGFVIALKPHHISVGELESRLRYAAVPIVARIASDRLLLDVSTLEDKDFSLITDEIKDAL